MNLVLTKECSKRCSFCFTGNYDAGTEMSFDFIERVVSHFYELPMSQLMESGLNNKYFEKREDLKLLGGEPTQHSKFTEIIELIEGTGVKVRLISNMLFPTKIREFLSKRTNSLSGILCNGMELDEHNRMKLFKKNISVFGEINKRGEMAIALTIDANSTVEKYRDYIRFLKEELQSDFPQWVRVGLDLSGMYILNNTYLGDIIRVIDEEIPEPKNIVFDCQVPPCIWGYDPYTTLNNFVGLHNSCDQVCLDIFKDGSAAHCYQAQNLKIDNIFDYKTQGDLYYAFRKMYKQKEKEEYPVPDVCQSCKYYHDNKCNGICIGCHLGGESNQLAKEIPLPVFYSEAPYVNKAPLQVH